MKRIGMTLIMALGVCTWAGAQVREDKLIILGAEQSALRIEVDHDTKMLTAALTDKLKQAGVKTGSSKGFIIASGAKLVEISPDLLDYYFHVQPLDKKRSVVFLSISKGYSNFIKPETNTILWDNAKQFLDNLVVHTKHFQMKEDAKTMEKELSAAQKTYDKSVKDYKKQEEALAKSRKAMEDAQSALGTKKADLEAIQSKIQK